MGWIGDSAVLWRLLPAAPRPRSRWSAVWLKTLHKSCHKVWLARVQVTPEEVYFDGASSPGERLCVVRAAAVRSKCGVGQHQYSILEQAAEATPAGMHTDHLRGATTVF